MKNKIVFYKIRNKTSGLYSLGGMNPSWNKRGKTWNNLGHIKSHLSGVKQHLSYENSKTRSTLNMREWEIVEYVFEKGNETVIPVEELILSSGLF